MYSVNSYDHPLPRAGISWDSTGLAVSLCLETRKQGKKPSDSLPHTSCELCILWQLLYWPLLNSTSTKCNGLLALRWTYPQRHGVPAFEVIVFSRLSDIDICWTQMMYDLLYLWCTSLLVLIECHLHTALEIHSIFTFELITCTKFQALPTTYDLWPP